MKSKNKSCVFCEIVAGREKSSKVYEDDKIPAFMSLRPVHPGEFVIIPKKHIDHFCDIPDDLATHIFIHPQRLSRKVREKLKPKKVCLVVREFGVPHAHIIIVPLHHSGEITSSHFARIEDDKITFREDRIPITPREELDHIAKLLREG